MPQKPVIKDSGRRQEFTTGSVRDTREGKGRYDLLPTRALARVAKHFEAGAVKYGDNNWTKGQPLSRYMDSALRHAFAHLEGKRDEPHLDAAIWNLMALAETMERVKLGILPQCLNDLLPDDTKTAETLGARIVRISYAKQQERIAKRSKRNQHLFARLEKASRPSTVSPHTRD